MYNNIYKLLYVDIILSVYIYIYYLINVNICKYTSSYHARYRHLQDTLDTR